MLNDAQWKDLEEQLKSVFTNCKIKIGNDVVQIIRVRTSESHFPLFVYINGFINPGSGWPDSDLFNPITEKVWRRSTLALYKPSEKKRIIKSFGKRRARELFPKFDETRYWYSPKFDSSRVLIRQLKKIADIELVDESEATNAQ